MKPKCVVKRDGTHRHEYRVWDGGWPLLVISEDLPTGLVEVTRGQRLYGTYNGLDEAFAVYATDESIPIVDCGVTA